MSNGVNKVFLLGNLGSDPEMRVAGSGTAVMRLRVATNERVKKGEQWEDHTEWHTVTVFGRRAEGLAKFLSKGHRVHVEGKLRTRQYEDREGNKRQSTEIIADEVTALGDGRGGRDERPRDNRRQAPPQGDDPMAGYATDGGDDDFPPQW